jgi:hypothetical protein
MTITDQDLWWATGYFDAKGSYHFKGAAIIIVVTEKDREVLVKFNRILGHGWIRSIPSGKTRTNVLQVTAKANVLDITLRFRPFVTRLALIRDMDRALADGRLRA